MVQEGRANQIDQDTLLTAPQQPEQEESKLIQQTQNPFEDMSFAEKLALKLGIKNVTQEDVITDFMTQFTDEDHQEVDQRLTVFEQLTVDYSCEIGKVGLNPKPRPFLLSNFLLLSPHYESCLRLTI